ncbi:MAG: family 43 glycosylhydrolase [Acidobacteriaceae bacterium]|nr:family 43 glycosylhydrolase [Acidobacteriaceae bacterium]
MSIRRTLLLFCLTLAGFASAQQPGATKWNTPHNGNPFIPGYNADATVLQDNGITYVFATEDPWGGRTLSCWMSADIVHWSSCSLNWPTKEAATSPTSKSSMVWAPSVIHAPNGRYYMYVSVGSEVWVGVADRPLGPWSNALGDRPLIRADFDRRYHMIDAEVFVDTDGQAYLYWGSGLNWVNGHCFVVRLKADMVTFDGEPKDVTPGHYFEGPFMFKHGSAYYLMYSEGKTTDDTYNVRYSVADNPFGPFHEGATSPILVSDKEHDILGPGHHAVFERNGKTYIVYHRHSLPFQTASVLRQLCMDELVVDDAAHTLHKVRPTHTGPALLHTSARDADHLPVTATASSTVSKDFAAAAVLDDNYATRWQPSADDRAPWLVLDLGRPIAGTTAKVSFEYAWTRYRYRLEGSLDGVKWFPIVDQTGEGTSGSPTAFLRLPRMRYLRLNFAAGTPASDLAIFEWSVYRGQ